MSDKSIRELIEASSLGAESARAAIESVSPEHGRLIVAMAEQRAKTEALAKFMFQHGKPDLSQEDRGILGPWEGLDEVAQQLWINLADAAYIHIADEIDSAVEQHTNGQAAKLAEAVQGMWRLITKLDEIADGLGDWHDATEYIEWARKEVQEVYVRAALEAES